MKTPLIALIIMLSCKITLASYTIRIFLDRFSNPGEKLLDGRHCDRHPGYEKCEHRFRLCLFSYNNQDSRQCKVKEAFKVSLGKWRNFSRAEPWQGDVLMKFVVLDKGKGKRYELVDKLSQNIKLDAYGSEHKADNKQKTFTLHGNHTSLSFSIVVYCNPEWTGQHCDCHDIYPSYCVGYDGKKNCHQHWYGPECSIECTPTSGIDQHYNCSSNGAKICHYDYYGKTCDNYCRATTTSYCSSNGTKVCYYNYYGDKCDRYCRATNKSSCSSDGTKDCVKDYYGDDCEVQCKTTDRYSCSSNGIKICHNNYHGKNCDTYCKVTNDNTGHYTCAQNGTKICHQDWCSEHCNVSCESLYTVTAHPETTSRTNDGPIQRTVPMLGTSDEKPQSKTKAGKLNLIIGVVAGAVALLIIVLIVFFCRRRKRLQTARVDPIPMQAIPNPVGHDNSNRMNENLYEEAAAVGPAYEDSFPNHAARKREAGTAANTSNDIYAVPYKKTKTQKQIDHVDASDDMLIVENELYGSAPEVKQASPIKAEPGAAANISDDMLIVDNELYGSASEVKQTLSHKVGPAANIHVSDDMLIVDNEVYGSAS